ncbi:MAG: hypothetical protein KC800_24925, partial [Candidatus Eremiobacteraeota bacterium]|nr:hypothetical protein [Candidatus Eremiobacteraeota bacterium]
ILVGKGGRGFCISSADGKLEFNEDKPQASHLNGTVFEVTGFLHENPVNKLVPSARWSEVPHQPDHFEIARSDLFGEVYAAATTRRFRIPPRALTYPVQIEFSSMDAPDLLLLFWSKHEPLAAANVRGVHRGIAYPMPNITLPRGFHAVVRADDLKPDLSYGGLVEDEAYKAKGKMLRGLVFRVLEKVVEADVRWSEEQVGDIRQKLDLYWPKSRTTESLRTFYKRHFTLMLPRSPEDIARFLPQLECLSQEELAACLDRYRPQISHLRSVSPQSARREMAMEGELRRQLGLVTPDYLHRSSLFQLLYDNKMPDLRNLEGLPQVWQLARFIFEKEPPEEAKLKQLQLHQTWRDFFLFTFWYERDNEQNLNALVAGAEQPLLEFILMLSRGRCEQALALASRKLPELSAHPKCWRTLVLEICKGRVSWGEQIKLVARSRFGRTDLENSIAEKFKNPFLENQILVYLVFDRDMFWPLTISHLLVQKKKGQSSLPFLFRLYLQSLLGAPGTTRTAASMSSWPVKLPLV